MRAHELQAARAELGLSQKAFGQAVGLKAVEPQRTVRNWESAKTPVPPWVDLVVEGMLRSRTWVCGHPRTPENTKPVGRGRLACRACRQAIDLRNWERRRERILAARKAERAATKGQPLA